MRRADGSFGAVESVRLVVRPALMYNLTVAEAHTFFVGEDAWLVHNTCPIGKTSGETVHTSEGKRAHRNYQNTLGGDYEFEVTLPSGGRVDAINHNEQVIRELKPDTPRAIKRGEKQVERYRQELEKTTKKKWTAYVDVYNKKKR